MKRLIFLFSFVLIGSLILYSNTVLAEETNGNENLSKENYDELIGEELLPEDVSYEDWLEINDESFFEDLEVPDAILDSDESPSMSLFAKTKTFTLKKGDILVSNGTSSKGLTGHAGIAISSSKILHISGAKNSTPKAVSIATWQKKYGIVKGQQDGKTHTKVYRVSNSSAGKAGTWAKDNYVGKKYSYGFTGKITSKNPTLLFKNCMAGL